MTNTLIRNQMEEDMFLASFILSNDNINWQEKKPSKRFLLTNPYECKNMRIVNLASTWTFYGGHTEWDYAWASLFVMAVKDAIDNNAKEADLTNLFTRDYYATAGLRYFSSENVLDHLLKWFDIEKNTRRTLKLKMKVAY